MVLGLFLLGLALGEAFIRTRQVYLSIGLHAGLVIGAKCWAQLWQARRQSRDGSPVPVRFH